MFDEDVGATRVRFDKPIFFVIVVDLRKSDQPASMTKRAKRHPPFIIRGGQSR